MAPLRGTEQAPVTSQGPHNNHPGPREFPGITGDFPPHSCFSLLSAKQVLVPLSGHLPAI